MMNMQKEINRMFDSFFRGSQIEDESLVPAAWCPAVDIAEHDDEFVVKMELPGVSREDVKITMQNHVLLVHGEKKQDKESKGSNYHRVERSYGAFQRTFTLPATVRSEKIDANFADGILNITLPKAEEAKPERIEVKVK
jgi:HSP20 family protein